MALQFEYLVIGAIFLCAFFLIEGIFYLLHDNFIGPRNVNRRMRMLNAGKAHREVYETLRRRPARDPNAAGSLFGFYNWLDKLVGQAGYTVTTEKVLMMMGGGVVALFLLHALLSFLGYIKVPFSSPAIGVVAALVLGIAAPIVRLKMARTARLKLFEEQLPNSLDIMVRSLNAGHPVSSSLSMVTKEMSDPIGSEFGIAVDEMTYGLELRDALENMAARVDVDDLRYVVVAINIQHETGGNLAEVLEGLSNIIRARFRMFKKVRALSAEGRLSMKILCAMPVVFGMWMLMSRPTFYYDVLDDPLFWPLLSGAVVMELIGVFIMYKMVNFRV